MNKAFITGRLTKAPELRTTTNGLSVATFTVACDRRGEQPQADYINITAWRQLADLVGKYLVKGQLVSLTGAIRTRSYDAQDGSKRYVTEVVADDIEFLTKPQQEPTAASTSPYAQQRPVQQQTTVVDSTLFNHYYNPQNPIQVTQDPVAQELQEVIVDDDLPF